ncbi:MAG TPA: serine hydrolase domain-containing protein [Bradyrhizobium sp.]|jgi:CubicO group peptidase (beta-lactamase class C family)|uniref:serine hydrolase domain-containing protein n=1 Tax=Bradyrhizobium sp. TaxID=376 RepID=UPI002CBCE087|nr:serine hydrolase domain-containing protein [Bradyrhizobium sp.]HWZ07540.1 serine hydrolase domain-containing protein [Bradyrhizobium sp.]HXB78975.1 serine hydrolase domain-containing protein [Bradyrhizobium sp.]
MTGLRVLATSLYLLATGAAFAEDPLPRARPEEVGLSSERLARIGETLKADIETGRIPGAVIAIARHGRLVVFDAYGWRDKAAGIPMTTDTIFNIASMTKPMTTVGALMLYERGKMLIDEPLAKYFPKFSTMRVAARDAAGEPTAETVPANRPITIQDLMRHTSGLIYGGRGNTLVHKLYPAGSSDAAREYDGPAFTDKLATLPLLHQPATVWDYGFGLDVLGLTIETIAKQSLGQYLQANLFAPLGMTDTGFSISADKAARYARPLPNDPDTGKPQARTPELTQPLKFECGGGCAASTASDYLRFAMMLLSGGRSGEARLLGPRTVAYMLSDQLGSNIKNLVGNADPTRADYGFGLGLAVRTTPGVVRMMGSLGQFSWPGASGTDWWVDPREELAVVYMSAAPGPIRWHYRQKINALVYQAIIE